MGREASGAGKAEADPMSATARFRAARASAPVAALTAIVLAGPAGAEGPAATAKTPITPELVLSFHIADRNAYFSATNIAPTWLADSRRIVYSRPDLARPGRLGIEIFDTKTGRTVRLGEGSDPRPSPDGKTVAFLRGAGAQRQVWLMGTDGKNPRALTRHADGLGGWSFNIAWSPDGNEIAYSFTPEATGEKSKKLKEQEKREREGKSSVLVYGSPQDLPPDSEIWLVDVAKGTERKVASYPTMLFELSWFPDGRRLLVYGFRHGASYREAKDESDVIVIETRTGERQNIVQAGGEGMVGRVSPDGSRIAFFYDADDVRYPDMYTVAVVAPQGGPVRSLTPKLVTNGRPIWSPDGGRIYYIAHAGAFSQIFAVSPDGGDATSLTSSPAMHRNVAASPDGNWLAWFEEAADGRARVVYAKADGSDPRPVVNLTPQYDRLALGEAKEVRWKSRDGLEIAGILVLPPGAPPGKPLPLVVELHGGPVGGLSVTGQLICIGPLERQIWAAKGYAVFAPDYRTSGAYGWDQILAGRKNQDFMDRDFDDITSGVDDLVRSGIADPDRMVVGGHSYGGVQTEWIITHSHAFKAAVAYEGVPDWYRAYGDMYSVGGNTTLAWQFLGRPWEVPENYFKNSALYMVKGVTIPTMFIVGDGVDYGGMYASPYEFMYSALKQQGVETQMLRYRKESHVVSKPENVRDLTARIVKWFDDHLKPAAPGGAGASR
jgi:dipeptidyl aminopeptidase/acylaminoacyl peptidase